MKMRRGDLERQPDRRPGRDEVREYNVVLVTADDREIEYGTVAARKDTGEIVFRAKFNILNVLRKHNAYGLNYWVLVFLQREGVSEISIYKDDGTSLIATVEELLDHGVETVFFGRMADMGTQVNMDMETEWRTIPYKVPINWVDKMYVRRARVQQTARQLPDRAWKKEEEAFKETPEQLELI